jgi:DNA replication protein DnaC
MSRFDWAKFPPRFRGKTLKDFVVTNKLLKDPRTIAIDALADGRGLFITGSPGTGKTHLAVAALAYHIPRQQKIDVGRTLLQDVKYDFLPSVEFFLELKASFSQDLGEAEILKKYSGGILLFDDVGSEKVSDWSRQMFYTLIDRRYRSMSQTIITSNMNLEQLSESIDDRISSRIVEMCEVISLTGSDWRLKK